MHSLNISELVKGHEEKLKKIKVFLTDVDGVLTNGHVYWSGEEVGFNRFFHVQDGYGLKVLIEAGIPVGIISGGKSTGLEKRLEGLGIKYIKLGNEDKRKGYLEIIEDLGVDHDEVVYIGDEFFDMPLLKKVGFAVTVPHASQEIKDICDYTTSRLAGEACVREVIDMIRFVQDITPKVEYF